MAGMPTQKPGRKNSTICLPVDESEYNDIVSNHAWFRCWLMQQYERNPELFPGQFGQGFCMKDSRTSGKLGIVIRRIRLRDGTDWSIRPSFVMPYMTALTEDVQEVLFLRKFAVPYWALAQVFGRNAMFYYRLQNSRGLFSLAGTTVRRGTLPANLLADEHHQKRDAEKTYIAATVGAGCWLGADIAASAGTEDLTTAYGVFRDEAQPLADCFRRRRNEFRRGKPVLLPPSTRHACAQHRSGLRARLRQYRRLGPDADGVASLVFRRVRSGVFPACVVEDSLPRQEARPVQRSLAACVGCVPRRQPAELFPTHPQSAPICHIPPERLDSGDHT